MCQQQWLEKHRKYGNQVQVHMTIAVNGFNIIAHATVGYVSRSYENWSIQPYLYKTWHSCVSSSGVICRKHTVYITHVACALVGLFSSSGSVTVSIQSQLDNTWR